MEFDGSGAWEVFLAHRPATEDARDYFLEIKFRVPGSCGWPDAKPGELMNLYCASRLNDVMLMPFQSGECDPWSGPDISREQYVEFWEQLGFDAVEPTGFHPFWCEIVEVTESEGDDVEVVDVLWPALTLGSMMFSRSGVRVRAPRALLAAGFADRSRLY